MSYQESAAYRLQKQEQERIQREQARQSAEASYKSLRAQYEEMVRKGYSGYVPDEMARLWSALEGINKQIGKDPYGARDACYSLGNEIPAVGRLAEAAIREFQAEEARRREYLEHARKSAESFYRRYEAQYEEMARKGYAGYIPDKMEQLRNDLQTVRYSTNPYNVGSAAQAAGIGALADLGASSGRGSRRRPGMPITRLSPA